MKWITFFSAISYSLLLQPAGAQQDKPLFAEKSLESGIYAAHKQRASYLRGLPDTVGPGACIININNDLWPDLLVLTGSGSTRHYGRKNWWQSATGNKLYLNLRDKDFAEIGKQAGVDASVNGQGCAVGDLDNDGDEDLLVTTTGQDLLYRNNGDNSYSVITDSPVTARNEWTTGATLVDINGDRRLDIYVAGFIQYEQDKKVFESSSGFEAGTGASFLPGKYDAVPSRLYLNEGGFRFRDITQEAGVLNDSGRTLGVYWHDVDNNGLMDLIELNGYDSEGKVWINRGDAFFEAAPAFQALLESSAVSSMTLADVTGDARADALFAGQRGQPLSIRQHIDDDLSWDDAGLARDSMPRASRGMLLRDFDNDGQVDLFLANGAFLPHMDAPAAPQGEPDTLYMATPDNGFRRAREPALSLNKSSRSALSADFDSDGHLDLYVSANNSLGQLFRNRSRSGHWLAVVARDPEAHRQPYKVTVEAGDRRMIRYAGERNGYLGMSSERLHVGLGEYDAPVSVTVQWQDGFHREFSGLAPDSLYILSPQGKPCRARGAVRAHLAECASEFGFGMPELPGAATLPQITQALLFQREALLEATSGGGDQSGEINPVAAEIEREHDETVFWLQQALETSKGICDVSRTAMALFDEEEAALQNKYMLVSSLVAALEQTSGPERRCVIKALAHSERYRANAAVVEFIDAADSRTGEAAIIALGRLRQTSSLPHLRHVILNGEAGAVAQAVVSAERIRSGYGLKAFRERLTGLPADQGREFRTALDKARKTRPIVKEKQN